MMRNTISVITDPFSGKRLLSKSELCNYIGLGHTKAEKWAIEHGVVRHIGRRVLYDRMAVDKAIDELADDEK